MVVHLHELEVVDGERGGAREHELALGHTGRVDDLLDGGRLFTSPATERLRLNRTTAATAAIGIRKYGI